MGRFGCVLLLTLVMVRRIHGFQPLNLAYRPPTALASSTSDLDALRGDARGAAVLLENVSVYRGSAPIVRDIDWRVEPRTKWALVGENGAGKSTLLKAMVGEIPHEGAITIGLKGRVGYLQQTAVAGSSKTIYEEASSGMVELQKVKYDMELATETGDWEALERATTRFEAMGGYQAEQKIANVLKGLGFTNLDQRCDQLSGGWQMRVAFARLLLSEPALALLDEPGNHLDDAAKKWLAKYLVDYQGSGSMILVTHDVELLKSMDHIAEVVPISGSLQIYKSCNYDQYLQLKEERAAAAVSEYERNAEKAAKLQSFVDRFGASATKASAAQSRVKQIDKMKDQGLLDAPDLGVVAQRFKPSVVLPDPPRVVGEVLLSLKDATIGHNGKALVSGVTMDVTKGMKLLIRGPNGSGKSTLLHSLRGSISLLGGERTLNPTLRLGMFTQDLAQELDPESRAVDLVTAYAREGPHGDITISDGDARSAMGRLGLRGEKALRKIRDLSGGEKARVALAMFSLKPATATFWDEPSNHLDTECVEALSSTLGQWGEDYGAVLVVSHDRNFCDQIEFTHVATVYDGKFILEQRSVRESDWVIDGLSAAAAVVDRVKQDAEAQRADTSLLDPALRKKAFNAPKQIAKLEKKIGDLEARIAAIDEEMVAVGSDIGKLVSLNGRREKLESQVAGCLEQWEELEGLLAQVA